MLSFKPLLKLSDYKSHKVIRVWYTAIVKARKRPLPAVTNTVRKVQVVA